MRRYDTRSNADVKGSATDVQYDKRGSINSATEELISLGAELIAAGERQDSEVITSHAN